MNIDHLSATQLMMYFKCGQQYFYRYVMGQKVPPGFSMVVGRAVHKSRELDLRAKMTSGADLPIEEVKAEASAQSNKAFEEDVVLQEGESKWKAEDDSVVLAALDYNANLVRIKPMKVEHEITLDIPAAGVKLKGIIDLVDDGNVIRDLKTASAKYTQDKADSDMQLTMYSLMHRISEGECEAGVQFDVLVKTKEPKAQTVKSTRSDRDIQVLLNRIARAKEGIEKELWVPAPSDSWACSPRWCGYANRCPYYAGKERVES